MSNIKNDSIGSLGFSTVIGIVFVILKLVGVIDWSWLWVLSPFWINFVFVILFCILAVCYYKRLEKH